MVIWGWSWNSDGVVGHPLLSLSNSLSLRGDVPHVITSIMAEAGTEIVSFSGMGIP